MAIAGHLRLQNLFNCCSWTTGFYGFKCSGIFWAYVYQTVLGEILVCKSMLHGRKIIDFWWHLAHLSPTSRTSWNVWKRFCRIESTQQLFSKSHNRHSFKGYFLCFAVNKGTSDNSQTFPVFATRSSPATPFRYIFWTMYRLFLNYSVDADNWVVLQQNICFVVCVKCAQTPSIRFWPLTLFLNALNFWKNLWHFSSRRKMLLFRTTQTTTAEMLTNSRFIQS